jgi:tetratricopeptide (TPR) repeat protein
MFDTLIPRTNRVHGSRLSTILGSSVALRTYALGFLFLAVPCKLVAEEPVSSSALRATLQRHLEAAKQAEQVRDYARAAEEYKELLSLRPQSAEICQNLGLVYHLQNKFQEAIPVFERALTLQPSLWGSSLFLGIDYYKTNQFAKALPALERALRSNPKDAETEARFWLGVTHLALRQFPEAIDDLQKRLDRSPNDIEVLYHLLQAHSQYSTELFKQGSRGDSDPARAYQDQGNVQAGLTGQVLERMKKLDPNSYRIRQIEGEQFEKQEQYPKALEAYKSAFDAKPELPGLRFAIGSVYWKTRQFDEAKRWLEDELKRNPHHAMANYQLGNILVYRHNSAEAIPHLEQALFAQPQFMEIHRDLGKAYLQLEQYGKAIDHFKQVAEAEPDDDTIHVLLADAFRKQGRSEEESAEQKIFQELNRKKLERAQQGVQKAP